MELKIIDRNGWSKTVAIHKAITRIGSASSNDIRLEASDIAPVHLQVIFSAQPPASCKLTNLSAEITLRTSIKEIQLPPYQTTNLRDGVEIELGDFRLVPILPFAAGYVQTAQQIDASISFQDPVLQPGRTAMGQLTITNTGSQPDCQFEVEAAGLPDGCIYIDPIPLMYPGAQESVQVELSHHGWTPEAGSHDVIFTITAPEHYPGEKLAVKQEVYILPVYKHSFEIVDDLAGAIPETPTRVETQIVEVEKHQPEMKPVPVLPALKPQAESEPRAKPVPKPEAAKPPVQDLSKVKVVSDQFNSFWEEE